MSIFASVKVKTQQGLLALHVVASLLQKTAQEQWGFQVLTVLQGGHEHVSITYHMVGVCKGKQEVWPRLNMRYTNLKCEIFHCSLSISKASTYAARKLVCAPECCESFAHTGWKQQQIDSQGTISLRVNMCMHHVGVLRCWYPNLAALLQVIRLRAECSQIASSMLGRNLYCPLQGPLLAWGAMSAPFGLHMKSKDMLHWHVAIRLQWAPVFILRWVPPSNKRADTGDIAGGFGLYTGVLRPKVITHQRHRSTL